jgi:hypothetical protein
MRLNAYTMAEMVREGINEYSTAYLQGTDTTRAFANADILNKLNMAQRYIADLLYTRDPSLFLKSVVLTGVNSVYTPPADFMKVRRLEDSDGIQVVPITIDFKGYEDGHSYYRKGNTLVVDKGGMSDPLTLWYFSRVRDMDYGMSTAGGALSLTLALTARVQADYYNGMTIANITDSWEDTISDYSAARVVTLAAQTGAASKYYGMVCELPEDLHHLVPMKALIAMKGTYTSNKAPNAADISDFNAALSSAFNALLGSVHGDVPISDLFE